MASPPRSATCYSKFRTAGVKAEQFSDDEESIDEGELGDVEEDIAEPIAYDDHSLVLLFHELNLEMSAARPRSAPPTNYGNFITIVSCLTSISRQLEEARAELTYESRTNAAAAPDDE